MTSLLRDVLPQARDEEIAALIAAGQGSPGRALGFAGLDMAALDRALATIAAEGDPTNAERSKLAKSLALKAAQPRYEAFLDRTPRSEEHTSELQSPMRSSYAGFCLQKQNQTHPGTLDTQHPDTIPRNLPIAWRYPV